MENELNYEGDIQIDPDHLDVEWIEQPQVFMKYAEECAHADKTAKRADEKLKTIRSEIILQANECPDIMGDGVKPTGQNIEAFYRTRKEYKEAKKEMVLAQHDADIMKNAVSAFHQRRVALENLVRLQAQGYFAGPTEPRDLGVEYTKNAKHKKAADRVKKKSTRTRRTR